MSANRPEVTQARPAGRFRGRLDASRLVLAILAGALLAGPRLPGADDLPDWRRGLQPDPARQAPLQELSFNNGTEPQTLDPALMTGVPESRRATNNSTWPGAVFETSAKSVTIINVYARRSW